MAALFMFFRIWQGFPDSFPFDRFNQFSDEELEPALQSHATELARDPEVQARDKRDQKAIVDRLREAQKKFLIPISREPRGSEPPVALPARKLDELTRWRDVFNRVYHPLGGKIPKWSPGERVWFYEATSREFAEQLIIVLNKCRNLDDSKCRAVFDLNPRYGIVSADGLSAGQQAEIRRCIQAIRDGKEPPVSKGDWALFLGEKAIQVAKELSSVWRPATPDQATSNAGSTPAPADPDEGEGNAGTGSAPGKPEENKREQSPPTRTKGRRKGGRGRPRLTVEQEKERLELLSEWWQARGAGIDQKTFCRDRGIKQKQLRRYVNWYGTRQSRNTNSD